MNKEYNGQAYLNHMQYIHSESMVANCSGGCLVPVGYQGR